jgi:hypothetical protein
MMGEGNNVSSAYETQRVLDYAPNHIKEHFADISSRVPNKKMIVAYQPPLTGAGGALPQYAAHNRT